MQSMCQFFRKKGTRKVENNVVGLLHIAGLPVWPAPNHT